MRTEDGKSISLTVTRIISSIPSQTSPSSQFLNYCQQVIQVGHIFQKKKKYMNEKT